RSLLSREIEGAYASLSQHASRVARVPEAIAGPEEPWRAALRAVHAALGEESAYDPAPPLAAIERTLREAGQARCAEIFALPLSVRARAFGVHLASLDIREHSGKTGAAVAELLRRGGVSDDYASASEEERRAILRRELATER